jgi:hypothetical protein
MRHFSIPVHQFAQSKVYLSALEQFKTTTNIELGILVKAMKIMNVSYGFVTTYMQTVFFKVEDSDGSSTLHYSHVVKHSKFAKVGEKEETIETVSL